MQAWSSPASTSLLWNSNSDMTQSPQYLLTGEKSIIFNLQQEKKEINPYDTKESYDVTWDCEKVSYYRSNTDSEFVSH